jgi:Uma2 family endonuclease
MAKKSRTLVPLETGDRLTRDEFHRRYCARPDIRRAELVQGVVYVSSPMRYDQHDEQATQVTGWLFNYVLNTTGVKQGSGGTIFLDVDSEVQPDAFLFREPPLWAGGIRRTPDDYLEGAPELVVEVAASSESTVLNAKLEAYRRAGVREYIVWLTQRRRIVWFHLRDGEYVPLEPDEHGVIESLAFPGLRLHVEKMLAGDMPGVLAELRPPS